MRKQTSYFTADGKTFETRIAARRHETDVVRGTRIADYFRRHVPKQTGGDEPAIAAFVTAILVDPTTFAETLSARAARRATRPVGSRRRGAGSTVLRRRPSTTNQPLITT